MELKFTASKKEILKTLKIIKVGLPKGRHKRDINVELQIGMNTIIMAMPGVTHEFYGKTFGIGKAFIPFLHFESMVKDSASDDVLVVIEKGKTKVGKFTLNNINISIAHVENIIKIDLPINYTLIDLLALKKYYSAEDLNANNFIKLINDAESIRDKSLHKALQQLKPFGFSYEELNSIIDKRVNDKLFQ